MQLHIIDIISVNNKNIKYLPCLFLYFKRNLPPNYKIKVTFMYNLTQGQIFNEFFLITKNESFVINTHPLNGILSRDLD